jgi:hypothetical protein
MIVGVIGYAAAPAKTPDQPIRIMYKTVAGKVLFDHKTHFVASGYGLACKDCHHHPEDDEEAALVSCGSCHQIPPEGETVPKSCTDCHEPDEIEDTEILTRSDAFHKQCENCHQESGAGPVENRCNWCHVS